MPAKGNSDDYRLSIKRFEFNLSQLEHKYKNKKPSGVEIDLETFDLYADDENLFDDAIRTLEKMDSAFSFATLSSPSITKTDMIDPIKIGKCERMNEMFHTMHAIKATPIVPPSRALKAPPGRELVLRSASAYRMAVSRPTTFTTPIIMDRDEDEVGSVIVSNLRKTAASMRQTAPLAIEEAPCSDRPIRMAPNRRPPRGMLVESDEDEKHSVRLSDPRCVDVALSSGPLRGRPPPDMLVDEDEDKHSIRMGDRRVENKENLAHAANNGARAVAVPNNTRTPRKATLGTVAIPVRASPRLAQKRAALEAARPMLALPAPPPKNKKPAARGRPKQAATKANTKEKEKVPKADAKSKTSTADKNMTTPARAPKRRQNMDTPVVRIPDEPVAILPLNTKKNEKTPVSRPQAKPRGRLPKSKAQDAQIAVPAKTRPENDDTPASPPKRQRKTNIPEAPQDAESHAIVSADAQMMSESESEDKKVDLTNIDEWAMDAYRRTASGNFVEDNEVKKVDRYVRHRMAESRIQKSRKEMGF